MGNINIENNLYEDILAFCEANDIDDIEIFVNQMIRKGFDMRKYGDSFAFFFNKSGDDIVHVKQEEVIEQKLTEKDVAVLFEAIENPPEPNQELTDVVEKYKESAKEEQVPEPTSVPEVVYKVKEEPTQDKSRVPVKIVKKDPKDNYDVYDEIK
jgi:hypothetical protein